MTVEAEIGGIGGREDSSGANTSAIPMTDPQQAAHLAAETGIDSLAIAIGNAHGVYSGEPHLDFDRLEALSQAVPVPLVLHGASGIPDADIRRCIELGVRKINVNTEIRQALFGSLQASLQAATAATTSRSSGPPPSRRCSAWWRRSWRCSPFCSGLVDGD